MIGLSDWMDKDNLDIMNLSASSVTLPQLNVQA